MKIRLKRSLMTAWGVLSPRAVIDTEERQLPAQLVQAWIASGYADQLEDDMPKLPPQDSSTEDADQTVQEAASATSEADTQDAAMEVKTDDVASDTDTNKTQNISTSRRGR